MRDNPGQNEDDEYEGGRDGNAAVATASRRHRDQHGDPGSAENVDGGEPTEAPPVGAFVGLAENS